METIAKKTADRPCKIRCVEVMISGRNMSKIHDTLIWTLSVYSLENRPVKKNCIMESEVFHFMDYDWHRTIKQLLEDAQIPYAVIGFFTLDNVFNGNGGEAHALELCS